MNKNINLFPIILSGGSGTRLWPLSRESFPKQYLSLLKEDDKSQLQQTILRLKGFKSIDEPLVICNEEHRFIVAEQLRAINSKPKKILLEPFGKNTAPAITIAALKSLEYEIDPLLLVLSADHLIESSKDFIDSISNGIKYALRDFLVTFGITPDYPETGYGYIKSKTSISSKNNNASEIEEFVEKPTLTDAKKLIKEKNIFWNSGIFLFKSKLFLNEINKFSPSLLKTCTESIKDESYDMDFQRINSEVFMNCENISIDKAVMERTNKGMVIPLNTKWSDLGNWQSIWRNSTKDSNNNSTLGKVILENTKGSYLRSEDRLIVGIGLKDLVIVDTKDALLIANNDKIDALKKVIKVINDQKIPEGKIHKKIYRPWGNFLTLEEGLNWKVKRIEVNPGDKLSLQLHKYRSEHWIVVSGTAEIEIDGQIMKLKKNQSTYIPIGSKHRISNPFQKKLVLIEVQSGSYLGEDDIIRFEDKYNRQYNS